MFKMKHIKTIAFQPQANGNTERMHLTLKNMIKTSMAENNNEWDENIKFINFAINTTRNETTGLSPFERTFRSEPNLPLTLARSPTHIQPPYKEIESQA